MRDGTTNFTGSCRSAGFVMSKMGGLSVYRPRELWSWTERYARLFFVIRGTALFLLLLIVGLSLAPCRDAFAFSIEQGTSASIVNSDAPTPSEEASEDCSPFCICACCVHTVASCDTTIAVAAAQVSVTTAEAPFQYHPTRINTHLSTIWQPPKA